MSTPTNSEIKEALTYALNIAGQGKISMSPQEAQVVLKNLAACQQVAEAIVVEPALAEVVDIVDGLDGKAASNRGEQAGENSE